MVKHATDRLEPSPRNLIEGAAAVQERFKDVTDTYFRMHGENVIQVMPGNKIIAREGTLEHSDVYRWRRMCQRFMRGDFRHRASEVKALKAVAQWTLEVNATLRNQPRPRVDL